MNGIFRRVGANLKSIALVFFWIQFIFTLVGGIACLFFADTRVIGVIMAVLAFPAAWLSNAMLYAFGDLVDNTKKIADATKPQDEEPEEILL